MVRNILFFDSMLTPKIITGVYWLLLVSVIVSGLGAVFSGEGFSGFMMGIVIIVVGSVLARIWCELLIVLFKINDNLKKIAEKEGAV